MNRRGFVRFGGLATFSAGLATVRRARAEGRSLTMVTSWPAGFPGLSTSAERVAQRIESATGGDIRIRAYSAGERVGPFEVFDAVASGEADLYHSADYYHQHAHPAHNFFTAVPFGLTADEMAGWIHFGGGQALWDELWAPGNIKPLMCTSTGTQMGGWFNREIRDVGDIDGLKIRMPGLGGEALAKLGAVPRNIPGGDIRAALEDGSLDAAEWVGPWNDLAAGLHEVANHYYYPGFHEPGGSLSLGINRDVWNSLSDMHRAIFEEAAAAEYMRSLAEFNVRNAAALATLQNEHGIVPKPFSDEVLLRIAQLSEDVVASVASNDPMTRRVYESFSAARRNAMRWAGVGEEAYRNARRLPQRQA